MSVKGHTYSSGTSASVVLDDDADSVECSNSVLEVFELVEEGGLIVAGVGVYRSFVAGRYSNQEQSRVVEANTAVCRLWVEFVFCRSLCRDRWLVLAGRRKWGELLVRSRRR